MVFADQGAAKARRGATRTTPCKYTRALTLDLAAAAGFNQRHESPVCRMRDVIVVGGGASGLMCAITAGQRGLDVLLVEKGPKVGLKILVSGGGRCNFTNRFTDPRQQFLSENPHFCISALKRYEPADFIAMVEANGISYHEKKLGQLFCDHSAQDIVSMLVSQCRSAGVDVRVGQQVTAISQEADGANSVTTQRATYTARQVVIASGGLSLPKVASDLAFRVANTLGVNVVAPRAALVPLRWNAQDKDQYQKLSGISVAAAVTCNGVHFHEDLLFTHRGLSGPAILQISSYWREGDSVRVNLLPNLDVVEWLTGQHSSSPQRRLASLLKSKLPNRLVDALFDVAIGQRKLGGLSPSEMSDIGMRLNAWAFKPAGSEGYRTAEVTLGGIDTREVSSKTFELKRAPGLFAIGEALDVTGWLGGYNFQWAWASGWCCGQHLKGQTVQGSANEHG
jgi:predicted Rossmann fold flavoprotein